MLGLAGLASILHSQMAGRPLADVLTELQDRGLMVVFSDRVVLPEMRVETEPRTGSLETILDALLREHGLEAHRTSTDWLVVVRTAPVDPPAVVDAAGDGGPLVAAAEPERQTVIFDEEIVVNAAQTMAVQVFRDGRPLRGLTVDDFEAWVDRKRAEVVGVEMLALDGADGSGTDRDGWTDADLAQLPASMRRHFMFTFDVAPRLAGSLVRAQEAAVHALRNALHPTDLVGIATVSPIMHPRIELGFTSDRSAAERAIAALAARSPETTSTLTKARTPEQRTEYDYLPELARGTAEQHFLDLSLESDRADRQSARHRALGLAASMAELAQVMRYTPGRKHVVLMSEGFDSSSILGATARSEVGREQMTEMNRAAELGEFWKVDSDLRYGSSWAQSRLDGMLTEFVRSDCTIEAVDVQVADADLPAYSQHRDGLRLLARRTGGRLYSLGDDLDRSLAGLWNTSVVTYLLSLRLDEMPRDGAFHRVRIRLRKGLRDAELVHGPGFYAPLPPAKRSREELERFLIGRVAAGPMHNDFELSVRAARIGRAAQPTEVAVDLDGPSLLATHEGGALSAEFHLYAVDASGVVAASFNSIFELDPERVSQLRRQAGLSLHGALDLQVGSYTVHSLVVNRANGTSGVDSVEIRVDA